MITFEEMKQKKMYLYIFNVRSRFVGRNLFLVDSPKLAKVAIRNTLIVFRYLFHILIALLHYSSNTAQFASDVGDLGT